jgi:hypothetical protein
MIHSSKFLLMSLQTVVASSLLVAGGAGISEVQRTGVVYSRWASSIAAIAVRFVPVSWFGASISMRVELYTPCAFAEFFGWQQTGLGASGGTVRTGAGDWTLRSGDRTSVVDSTVAASTGASGLRVTSFGFNGVTWTLQSAIALSGYTRYCCELHI